MLRAIAALCLFAFSHASFAGQKWHTFEVLVFARTAPVSDEMWRTDTSPQFPSNAIVLNQAALNDNANADAILAGAWKSLPETQTQLQFMMERMESNGDYRQLFHAAWKQPVGTREQTLPVYIEGGNLVAAVLTPEESTPEGAAPAEASPLTENAAAQTEGHAEGQNATGSVTTTPGQTFELRGTLHFSETRHLHLQPNLWFTTTIAGTQVQVPLTQSQRLKGSQLYYFDHPLFGMVVSADLPVTQ